jgi:hypothetical protein
LGERAHVAVRLGTLRCEPLRQISMPRFEFGGGVIVLHLLPDPVQHLSGVLKEAAHVAPHHRFGRFGVLNGHPSCERYAEVYEGWRVLGAPIVAALIREGEAAHRGGVP